MTETADVFGGDPLAERAEAGWRLGWDLLERSEAGAAPDSGQLETAIGHLRTAALDGIDGFVVRDPDVLKMLGLLLLLVVGEADTMAEAAEESVAAFTEGLDCPGLDEPLRLSLLNGVLLACRNRAALQESGADVYHPSPELAAARDALVAAAEALFLAVPPEHEWAGGAATAFIRALATRLIGRTGPDGDVSDLLRLLRARPDVRETEGIADAGPLVLIVSQALMLAFEYDGREELLLAVADFVAEARSWPDLPPDYEPLLTLATASVIVNSPDDGILGARLGDVGNMLDDAVGKLAPDDPHLQQVDIQRAMLLHRLAARGQDTTALAAAAAEIGGTMPRLRQQGAGTESAVLAGLLGGVLDTRFRRRQDLRDVRTGLQLGERALADFSGSALQRAILQANQGIQLLRMAWTRGDPETVRDALEMLRTALAGAPAGSPFELQLYGILAAGLMTRAQGESQPEQLATLREAWAAVTKAAQEEPPRPQTLVVQLALASALGDVDPQARSVGERAWQRLREVRSRFAELDLPTELIDMASSLLDGIEATRPGANRETLDEALSRIDALSHEPSYPEMGGQLLAMQQARMLRHRDNLNWQHSLQDYLDRAATQDVQGRQLYEWLERGGSDVSKIRDLMAQGLVEQVRDSPDRRRSRDIGVQVLRGHALRVLLQSGTQDAIVTARAASGDSHEVVSWCLADGADDTAIAALETGRGLTLLAAGAAGSVSDRLEAVGEPGLALAWRHSQDAAEPAAADDPEIPEDVRHRVLDRLAASGDLADLLQPPDRESLAATLRQLGYDALVYLIPQGRSPAAHAGAGRPLQRDGAPDRPGGALTVTAGGQVHWLDLPDLAVGPDSVVGGYLRAHRALLAPGGTPDERGPWRDTLEETCQWAWAAAMGPLRPALAHLHPARRARVVLVPVDALCVVPWHAAYPAGDQGLPPGERRYALDAVALSYAASGALLARVARRSPPVLGSSVLLVGDPGGDLPYAQAETEALRTAFYPGATTWGEPPERTDAAATPARLRAALADSGHSLFHYAGHATVDAAQPGSSALVLGDQRLRAEGISRLEPRASYCVCLAACTTHLATDAFDEVFTLSTAFLLGGASTVLGSLWRMKDAGTAVLMFMVHHYLSRGIRPVDALNRAQLWMLNSERRIPASIPAALRDTLPGLDLTDPVGWASLTHQGH